MLQLLFTNSNILMRLRIQVTKDRLIWHLLLVDAGIDLLIVISHSCYHINYRYVLTYTFCLSVRLHTIFTNAYNYSVRLLFQTYSFLLNADEIIRYFYAIRKSNFWRKICLSVGLLRTNIWNAWTDFDGTYTGR